MQVIEAIAAGVAAVASRISSVADFGIEDGGTGLLIWVDDVVGMASSVG